MSQNGSSNNNSISDNNGLQQELINDIHKKIKKLNDRAMLLMTWLVFFQQLPNALADSNTRSNSITLEKFLGLLLKRAQDPGMRIRAG